MKPAGFLCIREKKDLRLLNESLQEMQKKKQQHLQNQKATCNISCKLTKHLKSKLSKWKKSSICYLNKRKRKSSLYVRKYSKLFFCTKVFWERWFQKSYYIKIKYILNIPFKFLKFVMYFFFIRTLTWRNFTVEQTSE